MPLTDQQIAFVDRYIAGFTADLDAIPIEGTAEDQKLITALRALAGKIKDAIAADPALNYGVRDLITAIRRDHKDQAGLDARVNALAELDEICTTAIDTRARVHAAFTKARAEALAPAPHVSEARRAAILEVIEAQEEALMANLDNAQRVIDDLKVAHDLRKFFDDTIPELLSALDGFDTPEGAADDEREQLTALVATAREAVDKVLGPAQQGTADTAIGAARTLRDDIAEAVEDRARALRQAIQEAVARLTPDLAKVDTPPVGAFKGEIATLNGLVDTARAAIAKVIPPDGEGEALAAIEAAQVAWDKIAADVARRATVAGELGPADLEKAAEALGEDRVTALAEALHPPVRAVLDGSKIPLKDLVATLDGVFGGDVSLLADVLENGCGRDPDRLKAFVEAFPEGSDEQKELGDLVRDGGFGGAPGALSAVFGIGCDGDPTRLATLANDFRDAGDRENLAGLIGKGGLGDAPEALGYVFREAGSAKAIALGKAFQTDDDLAKLDDLVTKGGLGGASARSPDALASILVHGVDTPEELKTYHDAFQTGGMGDFRAMIAGFDRNPPPSDAGKQFRTVTDKVCPPPSALKDVYVKSLTDGARGSLARIMVQNVTARPEVADALAAATAKKTPATEAGMAATYGAASTLEAVEDVAGLDATRLATLAKAGEQVSAATVTMAGVAALRGDAKSAKEAEDAPDPAALKTASNAAAALAGATPPTIALIDAAGNAAAKALVAAKLTQDDGARAALLDAAEACFNAIKDATDTLSAAVLAEASTQTAAASKTKATAAKDQALITFPLGEAIFAAQKALDDAPPPRDDFEGLLKDVTDAEAALAGAAPPPATPQVEYDKLTEAVTDAEQARDAAPAATSKADYAALEQDVLDAQLARDAAKGARDAAVNEMKDAAKAAAQTEMARLLQGNPGVLAAQAEAARLAAVAGAPGAAMEDHLAAADAAKTAAKLLADAAAAPLGTGDVPTGIENPNKGASTIMTVATNDAAQLYQAAIRLDVAVTAALNRTGRATDAFRLQEKTTEAAADLASKPDPTTEETKAAIDAADALKVCELDVEAARDALDKLATQAKKLDFALQKNVVVHRKRLAAATATTTPTLADQQDVVDALEETVAICALILKRAYSASYPAMTRDDLFKFSSHTQKDSTAAMSEDEVVDLTNFPDCEVDTKHFCGRHTARHFGFEGRDFYPEDELVDASILQALDPENAPRFPMNMMKTTSLWPLDFTEADVKACLKLALAEVKSAKTGNTDIRAYMDAQTPPKARINHSDIDITYKGQDFTVQIGIDAGAAAGSITVGQFFPNSTPSVPFFDMHAIKSAMKH